MIHLQYVFLLFLVALPVIVGAADFEHCVDLIMSYVDHPQLNRTFTLSLVDLLMEALFPDLTTAVVQQQLLSEQITAN